MADGMVSQQRKKIKVLVVDDEPDMRIFLSRLLENGGFEPIVAGNGEEGLRKAREELPSLIILDLMITKEGVIQMYPSLKQNDQLKNIPVVMLSTIDERTFHHYRKTQPLLPGRTVGPPEGYLAKPPEAEDLLGLLKQLMDRDK